MAIGTYDRLHEGHIGFIQKLRTISGELGEVFIGVNSDEFATAYKRPPRDSEATRMANVENLMHPDKVFLNPGFGLQGDTIMQYAPDILVITEDWFPSERYASQLGLSGPEWFDEHGIVLCFVQRSGNGISTTKLMEAEQ